MIINLPCKPPTVDQIMRERKAFLLILGMTIIIMLTSLQLNSQVYLVLIYALIVCALFVAALRYAFKLMNLLSLLKWYLGIVVIVAGLLTWMFLPQVHVSLLYISKNFIIFCNIILCAITLSMTIASLQAIRKLGEEGVQQVYQARQKSNVIYEYVELIKAMPERELILLDHGAVFSYLKDSGVDYSDIVPDE